MGNLTIDMTRLCGEIDALRSGRGALMRDLASGASELSASVMSMRADFSSARAAMAKDSRKDLKTFVSGIKASVGSIRKDMADDLAGARRAWAGKRRKR